LKENSLVVTWNADNQQFTKKFQISGISDHSIQNLGVVLNDLKSHLTWLTMPSTARDFEQFTYSSIASESTNSGSDYHVKYMYTFTRSESKIIVLLEEERIFAPTNGESSIRTFIGSLPLEVFSVLSVQAMESGLAKLDSSYGTQKENSRGSVVGLFWETGSEDKPQEYSLIFTWDNEGPSKLTTFEAELKDLINQVDWEHYQRINWSIIYGGACLICGFLMFISIIICHTICCSFPRKEEAPKDESQKPMLSFKKIIV